MGEYGITPEHYELIEAKSDLKGKDVMKVALINELKTNLKWELSRHPRSIANRVFSEVIQKAAGIEYDKVQTSKQKILWVNKFMEEANEIYKEAKSDFDKMNSKRAQFMKEREQLLRTDSPESPKSSICPANCVMMGGRSYKYRNMRKSSRNMRKSSRNMRKSHRKSRK